MPIHIPHRQNTTGKFSHVIIYTSVTEMNIPCPGNVGKMKMKKICIKTLTFNKH